MGATARRRVYVISDLHLGGAPDGRANGRGFRIFTRTPELVSFIDAVARRPAGDPRVELVINGDFVDFLAEIDPDHCRWTPLKSAAQAEEVLGRITGPQGEGAVFDA